MILKPPFIIGARLLPALKIGDSYLSIGVEGDAVVAYVDTPDQEFAVYGFRPGLGMSTQGCFESMLSFMLAAAEAQDSVDNGRFSDNADIFEPPVMRWCQENAEEIGGLLFELEEEGELIR